jgi:hypothetical protein
MRPRSTASGPPIRYTVLLLSFISFAAAGCGGLTFSPSGWFNTPGEGVILVGRPQVFTRQRLVNRRLTEQQWLENVALAATPTMPSVQGLEDVRTFSGLYSKTAATFDPLGGKLSVAQNTLNVQNLQNQADTNAIQHQIDTLKLHQQLSALSTSPASTSPPASSPSATPAPSTPSSAATAPPPGATTPSPSGLLNNPPPVPSPADIVPSLAKITSIEFLRDQLAYRDAVQAALREQELDDSHDLRGLTLYTLKFDLSVLPSGQANDMYAKVVIALPCPDASVDRPCSAIQPLTASHYTSWIAQIRRTLQIEAIIIERRMTVRALTDDEQISLAAAGGNRLNNLKKLLDVATVAKNFATLRVQDSQARLSQLLSKAPPTDVDLLAYRAQSEAHAELQMKKTQAEDTESTLLTQQASCQNLLSGLGAAHDIKTTSPSAAGSTLDTPASESAREGVVTCLLVERYAGLSDLFKFGSPVPVTLEDNQKYFLPTIVPTNADARHGAFALQAALQSAAPHPAGVSPQASYVVTVGPKEEAQNISDVAAAEQLRNMVLSIQALIPQSGVTASNYTEYLSRSQQRIHAILRRPLVVGFADHGTRFGWILGPRFEIGPNATPVFNQTPAQHSAQVSVAVPGWMTTLPLSYTTSWVDKTGATHGERRGTFDISLPGTDQFLTGALLAALDPTPRPPVVAPELNADNSPKIQRLQGGQSGDLLVHGTDLWKNPKVFLGGQPADTVTVLPDMNGLSAHFNTVATPPRKAKDNPTVDITVVTSTGKATLSNAAQIFPTASVAADKLTVSLLTPIVTGHNVDEEPILLTVSAPSSLVPPATFSLWIRPILPGEDPSQATFKRPFLHLPQTFLVEGDQTTLFRAYVRPPDISTVWRDVWTQFPPTHQPATWVMQAQLMMAPSLGASPTAVPSTDGKPLLFAYFHNKDASRATLTTVDGAKAVVFDAKGYFQPPIQVTIGLDDVFNQAYPGLQQALVAGLAIHIVEVEKTPTGQETRIGAVIVPVDASNFSPLAPATGSQLPANLKTQLLSPRTYSLNSLPGIAGGQADANTTPQSGPPPSSPSGNKQAASTGPANWLNQRLAQTGNHIFRLFLVVSPNIEIPIDPTVTIKPPPSKPSSDRPGQPTPPSKPAPN